MSSRLSVMCTFCYKNNKIVPTVKNMNKVNLSTMCFSSKILLPDNTAHNTAEDLLAEVITDVEANR